MNKQTENIKDKTCFHLISYMHSLVDALFPQLSMTKMNMSSGPSLIKNSLATKFSTAA